MDDKQIIKLFLNRNEAAVTHIRQKYADYCYSIAFRILGSPEDAEEVVNDTWLRAWNTITAHSPENLKLYLAGITRNLSIDRCRMRDSQKRGGTYAEVSAELADCIAAPDSVHDELIAAELSETIHQFLSQLSGRARDIFLRRYFFFETTEEIAKRYAMRESNVLLILSRTRKKLKKELTEEGYFE